MSASPALLDRGAIDAIAARLDLRNPNREALESIVGAVAQHYDVDQRSAPFEAVVDLATAVGKTYIMAAAIEYFAAQGFRDFAVITPGKTILRKTVANFTPGAPKSLLPGMDAQPVVLTSDNFATPVMRAAMDDPDQVKLYVFTVQALLKPDTETGRRTRKFQEGLGKAFYDHLRDLPDLIVFADEHHCYYGKAFSGAIRDLVPRALIGLTATPDKKTPTDQIIYRYPLSAAIADRLVKTPVLVGRKDDRIDPETKLRDGLRLLAAKQEAISRYCAATGANSVNPMMLVVAPTIEDANRIEDILKDPAFAGGTYADKILNINSASPDDALEALDHVEDASSTIRVIVSVGMLKEGWDVKSVYVIASLRPSISEILTEQTLGRGLRLPFGSYTGIEMLDTLEVLAHEKYEELLKKANVINEAFLDFRTWIEVTRNAAGQEVARIATTTTQTPVAGEDGTEPGAPARDSAEAMLTSVEVRVAHVEEELRLTVEVAPRSDLPALRIPRLVMQGVESRFSIADITDRDSFKRLGERLAADSSDELRRVKVSAQIIEGRDGLRRTQLIRTETADEVRSEIPLLPIGNAVGNLTDLVMSSSLIPGRSNERAKLAPLIEAVVDGLGSRADVVLSAYLDRVAARVIGLIGEEQKKYAPKPEFGEVVELVDLAPVRLGRGATTTDRFGKFERGVGYEGWKRSMYSQDWFDSGTERDAANILDAAPEISFWVRLEIGDCPILWSGMKRHYNPDFIVAETSGTRYILEIKMEKEAASSDVLGKAEAAKRWANYVNADPKTGANWQYILVLESDVAAAHGSWSALKGLTRT